MKQFEIQPLYGPPLETALRGTLRAGSPSVVADNTDEEEGNGKERNLLTIPETMP
jgi:hypothetical protein